MEQGAEGGHRGKFSTCGTQAQINYHAADNTFWRFWKAVQTLNGRLLTY